MSTIDISSQINQASAGEFIPGDEKAALADEGTALYVVGVEPASETRYGTQTLYYVKSAKWGREEQRILAFSHNAYRERQAQAILNVITESKKAGGPVYLGRFRTSSGHDAWELRAEPQQQLAATPVAPAAAPAAPAAPAPPVSSTDFDADLPF